MKPSSLSISLCIVMCSVFFVLNIIGSESALPFGIFPFLTSGWYYKPNPTENVIFGLIVVKVLAVRLASILGVLPIPYHLNDLFTRSLGKRSLPDSLSSINLTMPQIPPGNKSVNFTAKSTVFGVVINGTNVNIDPYELNLMLKLLQGVKRMDTNNCFLKALCVLSQEDRKYNKPAQGSRLLINTVNYLTNLELQMGKWLPITRKSSTMNVFHEAIQVGSSCTNSISTSCDAKYSKCSLKSHNLMFNSVLS